MRPDGAFKPPKVQRWRGREAALDPDFIAEVMALWDLGRDSREIAARLVEREAMVLMALVAGREQRRRA